jgi:hypothetical protein
MKFCNLKTGNAKQFWVKLINLSSLQHGHLVLQIPCSILTILSTLYFANVNWIFQCAAMCASDDIQITYMHNPYSTFKIYHHTKFHTSSLFTIQSKAQEHFHTVASHRGKTHIPTRLHSALSHILHLSVTVSLLKHQRRIYNYNKIFALECTFNNC